MVDKIEKENCNGCAVCGDICPHNAITFESDFLTGFLYPKVDSEKCVHCGICVNQCPQNHPLKRQMTLEPKVYAAWSKNDSVRMLCSSGGLFYELASEIIEQGGAVVACRYTMIFEVRIIV